jgi:hypothetical protein
MQKWEYLVLEEYPSQDRLDELGGLGWELVAAVAGGGKSTSSHKTPDFKSETSAWGAQEVYVYLKRPK